MGLDPSEAEAFVHPALNWRVTCDASSKKTRLNTSFSFFRNACTILWCVRWHWHINKCVRY